MVGESNSDNTVEEPKKPEAPEWLLENIKECSKNASRVYTVYLGFLAYCALTVVSTTDRQILLNQTALLPIVNAAVPLNLFFVVAPVAAVLVFLHFQSYLFRLKGLVGDLKANYPQVERRRLYPWIINIAEDSEGGIIGMVQRNMVGFSLWCSLPMVLFIFTIWIVKKHSEFLSYYNLAVFSFGFAFVLFLWFKHYGPQRTRGRRLWKVLRSGAGVSLVILLLLFVATGLIPEASDGFPRGSLIVSFPGTTSNGPRFKFPEGRLHWVGQDAHNWLRRQFCLDLSYQKLVEEPSRDYRQLYWGNLRMVHLEGANLVSTVLKRADLRGVSLRETILLGSALDSADLTRADLTNAVLQSASLRGAMMDGAVLNGAVMIWSNLAMCSLEEAKARKTLLYFAVLDSADLAGADLTGATLALAEARGAQLQYAVLDSANLTSSNFAGADLAFAKLRMADLSGVIFDSANLSGADFSGATHLTAHRLVSAKNVRKAIGIDTALLNEVDRVCPDTISK